jgi:clan AA aspartic protease
VRIGEVTPNKEATVGVTVLGSNGVQHSVTAILDTGYTEYLTLPKSTIAALGLNYRYSIPMILADGRAANMRVFDATVYWAGSQRSVPILETTGDILLGMSMLYGLRVCIDVVDGGDVELDGTS